MLFSPGACWIWTTIVRVDNTANEEKFRNSELKALVVLQIVEDEMFELVEFCLHKKVKVRRQLI